MPEPDVDQLRDLAICYQCIGEPHLKRDAKKREGTRECAYCNQIAAYFTLEELADRINEVFDHHYVQTSNEPAAWQWAAIRDKESTYEWEREGAPVVEAIMDLVNLSELAAEDIQRILEDKHSSFDSAMMGEETDFAADSAYEAKATDIQTWVYEWESFKKSLQTEARFFSAKAAATLKSVFRGIDAMQADGGRPLVVNAGPGTPHESFYRARVFPSNAGLINSLVRPDLELGGPPSRQAPAGRMNARGISVFYGSNNIDVAIAEVRPPVGSDVVVARFDIIRPLRLLDLAALKEVNVTGSLFDPQFVAEMERSAFLRTLSHEIVKPVMPDDEALDYLPTQAVADFLATEAIPAIDGILFPSVQAEEKDALNIVLFHKAAKVAPLDMPKGTKIEGSDGHWGDDGWETEYTVWELVPPAQKDAAPENLKPMNVGPLIGYAVDIMEVDDRTPTLRIDTSKIGVHAVQKVKFKTCPNQVTRHRMEDHPTVF